VDWRPLRAVVLESDDWGLAGFVPDADSWDGLDRAALGTGRFPAVYWGSTLEDGAAVSGLAGILAGVADADGLPAAFQPNYVMGSLHWSGDGPDDGHWEVLDLPRFPPGYARPDLWDAVASARARGVWHPEFHAAFHYDPDRRREAALETPVAAEATRRGILLFPGSEKAREMSPRRTPSELEREFDHALRTFGDLFGRAPRSIMAPDYTWNGAMEQLWISRGVRIIQGKREQIDPGLGHGSVARLRKYLGRRWDELRHGGRVYLERNCRLEPVQAPDPDAVVADCLAETRAAWRHGRPAIVETHRVNFAHTDPAVVRTGRRALRAYLDGVTGLAEGAPRFLVDAEVADLTTRGTSSAVRGGVLVVRNATRGRKVVAIPAADVARLRGGAAPAVGAGEAWLVPVGPREVKKLDADGALIWRGAIR